MRGDPRPTGWATGAIDATRASSRLSGKVSGTAVAGSPARIRPSSTSKRSASTRSASRSGTRPRTIPGQRVSPGRNFFLSRGFSPTTKTPSFGAESVSAATAVSSLSRSLRARSRAITFVARSAVEDVV